jgi:hypothetical protein
MSDRNFFLSATLNIIKINPNLINCLNGVLALSMVDFGFESRLSQTKTIKLEFTASPLSTQDEGVGWL